MFHSLSFLNKFFTEITKMRNIRVKKGNIKWEKKLHDREIDQRWNKRRWRRMKCKTWKQKY